MGPLFEKKSFRSVLQPGTHWFADPLGKLKVEIFDITQLEFTHPLGEFLVKRYPELTRDIFHVVELADEEAGFLYVDGKLSDLLEPASRRIFWLLHWRLGPDSQLLIASSMPTARSSSWQR